MSPGQRRRRRAAFRAIAPRLEAAHAAERDRLAAERAARIAAAGTLVRAEWLVAHRELQLLRAPTIRAGRQSRRRYEAHRARKLEAARRELGAARRRASALGVATGVPASLPVDLLTPERHGR